MRRGIGRAVLAVHVAVGLVAVALLLGMGVAACSRGDERSAGDVLQERLESQTGAPSGHDGSEGALLGSTDAETVSGGVRCRPDAPVREFGIAAVHVEITLNRFLDYDPNGLMYVLEERLDDVRREESQNRAARAGNADPAVSLGLQGDAIQPLILRVNQGECLRVRLRNGLDNTPASFHLHGSSLYVAGSGAPAVASNPDASAAPAESVVYEWMVDDDEPEGTHYFHSHGDARLQTGHGLFGAVIVEKTGSVHIDPRTGDQMRSGWDAIVETPDGSDFREFAIVYHEIGNERYRHLDRDDAPVAQVDPFTSAYRPGSRALNYRSEPFMNRMVLQHEQAGFFDVSQAYSSYVFGDPATPIARAYLGDPVKQRLVHGGSEVFHVHHVHGGAVRWRRQPGVEPTDFDTGLVKRPPLLPKASARIDSQAVGPSETYDIEDECGAGGCQQSVGDFLIHCHVAHHYIAGMWMFWRVYNTLQDGEVSQDKLAPLVELPDRAGKVRHAVTSEQLLDTTVSWGGRPLAVTEETLPDLVERQLPPAGKARGYDASVLDWERVGRLYLNEPEDEAARPSGLSEPGPRRPFYFDPLTGKLAYPFLRPHLGKRPPFAPGHGPAPFLSPASRGRGPPAPGESGPASLCPSDTRLEELVLHAINVPIVLNERAGLIDPAGQLFVLKEDEERVRADNDYRVPLAIRGNAGESCVDILLKSELEDSSENSFFSKVNIHVHFVQFDILASDGVSTGFGYEQSVRPFTSEGETVSGPAEAGSMRLALGNTARFQPGILVGVGMDQADTFEVRRIESIEGEALVFEKPLEYRHAAGEVVSTEFVRYRWYPDVQFGTAYFHDHVRALTSWEHGLFGAFISEPPGSTYHDPYTGEEITSGPIADVHTDSVVSADVTGSFREMVMFIQDGNALTNAGDSSGSSLNLRVEPLASRGGDPALLFSSVEHGDPATPILEAHLGDPIVIRTLVSAANDVHTWHLDGHWFRAEPHSSRSPPVNTVHVGISERYDLAVRRAGGPQERPGDYLYYNGRAFKLLEGSWGIVRVQPPGEPGLMALPGRERGVSRQGSVCPVAAPLKEYAVTAIDVPLPMLSGSPGKIYALEQDVDPILTGIKRVEPLVLHVNVGDCVALDLTNSTDGGPVSVHADMLAFDPSDSYGAAVGRNPEQLTPPGETRRYTFYAHPEVGETVALLRDWGDALRNPALGLYGAIVVGPEEAVYTHPVTGEELSGRAGWRVDVHPPDEPSYRDFTVFLHDEDPSIGTHLMPYAEHVAGVVGLSYHASPLSGGEYRDSKTPTLEALAGDPVRVHVLAPYGEQAHVFTIEGHRWPLEPGRPGSSLLSSVQVGPLEAVTMMIEGGAGAPGDYIYGDHREPYREAGLWGVFRVNPPGGSGITPLR